MLPHWTPEKLIAFEKDLEETFNRGEIRAPLHLAGGNERNLISLFQGIRPQDWVCGTWRAHYHCLLKGLPADELKAAIVAGRSIALCFKEQRVICSAMVGGIIPIALGLAWAIKHRGLDEKVWCFIGDMSATTGIAYESMKYRDGFGFPLNLVIEDNLKSVDTDTHEVWNNREFCSHDGHYEYELPHKHVGTRKWVSL